MSTKETGLSQPGRTLAAQLQRGRMEVTVEQSAFAPEELFGFAERRNPKRAFLFVSKILGRHVPARPAVMSASYDTLAKMIPSDLPGPVLVIGMAETAVGLGAGVHRAYRQLRNDALFLPTTRHPLGTPVFTQFEEEHSHASRHLVHMPATAEMQAMLLGARSLVLVDDEASTGKTFANLYRALISAGLGSVERVVTCVLTDWSGGTAAAQIGESASSISLLSGRYQFEEDMNAPLPDMPNVATVAEGEWAISRDQEWGRLGATSHLSNFGQSVSARPGQRILVVGTSEFVWPPFLLAERLAHQGADVWFSSTSRSPIAIGHEIKAACSFPDNYGLGIPNFLYNVDPKAYDRILICVETPKASVPAELLEHLSAEVISAS